MSACSGRNSNFRCIKYRFLACFCASQRVQRREAKLTLAQIREKLPNGWADWHQIWHTCAHSYGNRYTPNKLPPETQGMHLGGGFRGSTIQVLGSCPIDTNFGSPRWHLGGGLGCHKFKSWEAVKRLDRLPQIWHTSADPSGNGYTPNKLPLETQGMHLGGFRGSTIKSIGKLSDWHQLWFTSAD